MVEARDLDRLRAVMACFWPSVRAEAEAGLTAGPGGLLGLEGFPEDIIGAREAKEFGEVKDGETAWEPAETARDRGMADEEAGDWKDCEGGVAAAVGEAEREE